MADLLPVRKYVRVWIKKRKNNVRVGGKPPTVCYTLQWVINGQPRFLSLDRAATLAYAKEMARRKEAEINSTEPLATLETVRWGDFQKKYLDTKYPGHDLPTKQRQEAQKAWAKSFASMRSERLAMENFNRL